MFVCYPGCSEVLHKTLLVDDVVHSELDIVDMAPSDFEHLIRYMYLGKISFDSVHELCFALYAAERFELPDLRVECLKRLQKRIKENHGCAVELIDARFKFPIVCDKEHVLSEAVEIVMSNYEEALTSECICSVAKDTMELLLNLVPATDVEEIVVFRSLLRWSEAFCNRNELTVTGENLRAAAGDLANAVQYNLIPAGEIDSEVAPSGLLDQKHLILAFRSAIGGSVATPFGKQPEKLAALLHQVRQPQRIQREMFSLI